MASSDVARASLASSLRAALGWDAEFAADVVASLAAGAPPSDVLPLLDGNGAAEAAVAKFVAARDGKARAAPAPAQPPAANAPARPGGRAGGALTFKEAKGKAVRAGEGGPTGRADRPYANCLSCGLVVPTTGAAPATKSLLATGECPACGARVRLRAAEGAGAPAAPFSAAVAPAPPPPSLGATLVDEAPGGYDDVAANVWLTPPARAAARAAAADAAAAAADAARCRTVHLAVDLMAGAVSVAAREGASAEEAAAAAADAAAVAAVRGPRAAVAAAAPVAALSAPAHGPGLPPAPGLPFEAPVFCLPPAPAEDDAWGASDGAASPSGPATVPGWGSDDASPARKPRRRGAKA